jgi:hypothetical protein
VADVSRRLCSESANVDDHPSSVGLSRTARPDILLAPTATRRQSSRSTRGHPGTDQATTAGSGSGRRVPGRDVDCCWCGQPVPVRSRGPIPEWCSPTCRHRAWEQTRAARSGRSAIQVLDRYVAAVPDHGPGWIAHLNMLTAQITTGSRPITDHDLDDLATALDAQVAIANRTPWRRT